MRNKKDTSKPCPASLASLSSSAPTATRDCSNCERESTIATGAARDVFGPAGPDFSSFGSSLGTANSSPGAKTSLTRQTPLARQTLRSAGEGGFPASSSTGSSAPRAEFPHDRAGCPTLLLSQTIRLSETHALCLSKTHALKSKTGLLMRNLLHLNLPRLLVPYLLAGAALSAVSLPAASPAAAQGSFPANSYLANSHPSNSHLANSSLKEPSPTGLFLTAQVLTAQAIAFELRYGSLGAGAPPPRQAGTGDKALHTLVSMSIVVGAYYGSREAVGWPQRTSLLAAGGSALGAGLLKEMHDRSKIGNRFSEADMIFNVVGTGMGIGVVLGLRES